MRILLQPILVLSLCLIASVSTRRRGRPMDLAKLEREIWAAKRGRNASPRDHGESDKVAEDQEPSDQMKQRWRHMAKINPYIGNILFAFSSVNKLMQSPALNRRRPQIQSRNPAHHSKPILSDSLAGELTGTLDAPGISPHLNLGNFLEPFRKGSLTGDPEETEEDAVLKGQLLSVLNRPDFQHLNLGNVLQRYLREKENSEKPHPPKDQLDLGQILSSILHQLSKLHPDLDEKLYAVLHDSTSINLLLVNFVNILKKVLHQGVGHLPGGGHQGGGSGGLDLGKKCFNKVTLSEQVIFEEKEQCTKTIREECVPVYKTELVPTEVTECNTRFKKVCYFEYSQDVRQRLVRTCAKKKERDCDAKGKVVCTHEREMVCERLADEDKYPMEDADQSKGDHSSGGVFNPSFRRGKGTFSVPAEFFSSPTTYAKNPTNEEGEEEGKNEKGENEHTENDPDWVDASEVDEDALDCRESYEEVCDPDHHHLQGLNGCLLKPKVDCRPFGAHTDQPVTRCRQVSRQVCGPEPCPVVEGELECQEKLKRTAEEVPVETCHMAPENVCRKVHKILPKLVTEERCVDTPRESCVRVTLPKTIKKPTIQKICAEQERNVLLVVAGCDGGGLATNSSIAVDLAAKTHFFEFVEIPTEQRKRNSRNYFGIYKPPKAEKKPGFSFVNVGPKPHELPTIAKLPYRTAAAVGGLTDIGFLQCGGTTFSELCVLLDPTTNSWRKTAMLPEKRLLAGGSVLDGNTLFMAGGYSETGPLDSTLFVKEGTMVTAGPNLPNALIDLCVVALSSNQVFLSGGLREVAQSNDGTLDYSAASYLHTVGEGGCDELPDMALPRASHACAVVPCADHDDATCVMVAGGLGAFPQVRYSTEVLNLKTKAWSQGPDLPYPLVGGALLPFNGTVIAVGGVHSHLIFELDVKNNVWIERREKLAEPRSAFVASMTPKSFFETIKNGKSPSQEHNWRHGK